MKVAIIIHSMGAGGAERVSAQIANCWNDAGDEVHLITISGEAEEFYPLHETVKRHWIGLDSDSANFSEAIGGNINRVRALRKVLKRVRPDILVGMMTGAAVIALLASRGLNMRVIVSERTYPPCYPLGYIWELLRRLTYPWAYRVVMQTTKGLNWLNRTIPAANGVVIPNQVSYPLPQGIPAVCVVDYVPVRTKMLLAVGRLDEGKQFDKVVEAFSRVASSYPDWHLVILGDGPERGRLHDAITRLGLGGRICMPGRVGNVGDWYIRADLYVMSSRFEGFPNSLAEAMAHGCAVVSYDCDTGPRDIIRHGVDGLLVSPVGDVDALEKSLNRLMKDEGLRKAMSEKAIEVRERFSSERVLSQWKSIMKGSVSVV